MENFTVNDKNSSVIDNAEDIKTIAKSYLMYKIGKFSFVVFICLIDGFASVSLKD